jgi:hypothetical protein
MSYLKSLQNLRKQVEMEPVEPVQATPAIRPRGLATRQYTPEPKLPQYEPLTFARNAIRGVREAREAFQNNLKRLSEEQEGRMASQPQISSSVPTPSSMSGGDPQTSEEPSPIEPVSGPMGATTARPRARPTPGELHIDLSNFEAPENELRALAQAIKDIESSGGDYTIRGPEMTRGAYRGQRAMGAYQVMPGNLPQWSMQALGREVTEEEFMSSPEIQDTIFFDQMVRNYRRHGSWEDAASVWFTGRPVQEGSRRSDGYITGSQYVQRFQTRFNQYLGASR